MPNSKTKKLLKSIIKEAFQEEIKDILLEALKGSMVKPSTPVNESVAPNNNSFNAREKYLSILNETKNESLPNHEPMNIPPNFDVLGGTLPSGEVDLSMIKSLIK